MALEVLKKIDNTFKLNIIRVREIIIIIRNEFPNSVYIRRDIYNACARLRRRNFEGYILIGILIKLFNDNDIKYIKKMDLNNPNRLLGLIFTFLVYIKMVKIFLEVYIYTFCTLFTFFYFIGVILLISLS